MHGNRICFFRLYLNFSEKYFPCYQPLFNFEEKEHSTKKSIDIDVYVKVYSGWGDDHIEYTVQKLARLAGVSARTLRYYDEIGILKPARINSSGYRIYGQNEVNRLQQILFYKELGVSLDVIKDIVTSPNYDGLKALRDHREQLLSKRKRLDVLIANVEKTIASMEGRITMTDQEKFEGFKQEVDWWQRS